MFVSVQRLIDSVRLRGHPSSRVKEVVQLRSELRALPHRSQQVSRIELERARELRQLRAELSATLTDVESCKSCARGYPEPHGFWDGGNCCGATTRALFDETELATLRLAGTTAGALDPPSGPHAGCAFRGETGCSLDAVDRPNICVRYVCRDLARELHTRGLLDRIDELRDAIGAAYKAFTEAREARLLDEALGVPDLIPERT